jgi:hypothetical protein
LLQPLYSLGRSTSRRLGGPRDHLDTFGMRKISYSCQGVEPLIIKPIEFDVCNINTRTYYKNCNVGTYKFVMQVLFNCALIGTVLESGQDDVCLMILSYRERITSDVF